MAVPIEFNSLFERPVPDGQTKNQEKEDGCQDKKISGLGEESKGGAIPFFFNLLPFSGRYPGEPNLDLPQQCQISFFTAR
jgi:hypothetical protein